MMNFDIKRKINTLRDILVGKVPDPKAQVEQITIALIYKFMDDMDLQGVEFGGSRVFFTGEYEKYAFSQIMLAEHSAQDKLNLYAEGMDKMVDNPDLPKLFRDILRNTYIPYRDPDTLNRFLKEIAEFSYDDSEDLGNAFEYLLSIMGSQGDAGQFRTPRHIIDMMIEIVAPQKNESILDPACGTAGFLISAYNYIKKNNVDENGNSTLTPDDRNRMTDSFEGYDISPDMVRLSRVNMYLHGFTTPKIHEYDTLTSLDRWDDNFDVILANPPFMTPKGGINPHKRYRVDAKRAEVLFVDYIAEHLSPTGRAAIIVPEGIVFQSQTAYKNLRKMLVDEGYLYGVISLPSGVFNPYSGVKTSILLIDRTLAKTKDSILFVKLNNDGYDLGAQRREIKGSEIPDVINIFKDYQEGRDVTGQKNVVVALKSDVAKQEYILVGERYKTVSIENTDYPIVRLREVCSVNDETYDASKLEKFIYVDISAIDSQRGNINYSNVLSGKEAPSRARRIFRKNDILLSTVRPNLKAFAHVERENTSGCIASTGFAVIRCGDKVNSKFLYYLLLQDSLVEQMIAMMGKGAYPSINQNDVYNLRFPLPPLSTQEEIVSEIEQYQKIIDGAKQVVNSYSPKILDMSKFNSEKLGNICIELRNGANVEQIENTGKYRVTRIQTIADGTVDLSKTKWTNDEPSNAYFMNAGDILFSHINSFEHLAKTAIFPECEEKVVHGINLIRFRIDKNKALPEYVAIYMKSDKFISDARKYAQRAVNQASIKTSDLRQIDIPLPSLDIQAEIVNSITEEMKIVESNKRLIKIFEGKISAKLSEVWGD